MLILIILLPLLGFFSGSLFGRYLSKGVCFITTFNISLSLLFSVCLFIDILSFVSNYKVILGLWILVSSGTLVMWAHLVLGSQTKNFFPTKKLLGVFFICVVWFFATYCSCSGSEEALPVLSSDPCFSTPGRNPTPPNIQLFEIAGRSHDQGKLILSLGKRSMLIESYVLPVYRPYQALDFTFVHNTNRAIGRRVVIYNNMRSRNLVAGVSEESELSPIESWMLDGFADHW